LKWRSTEVPPPKDYLPLSDSPFYQNSVEFRDILMKASHMVVMIGPGNKENWKIDDGWEEASVKLSHALASPNINQHSGEALVSCITTVEGWHAKNTTENMLLYGRYCWSALKVQIRSFELRYFFHHCYFGISHDEFESNQLLRREIMQDEQKTFRFRTEISERTLVAETNNIPVIDQIHQHHPHLKAKPEPGEGQPCAPTLIVKEPWKPSLPPPEETWAEGMVDSGLSTTAPSTQATQANMPALSSAASSSGSVQSKIETKVFPGGSNMSSPRGGPPPKGEEQPSASASSQAEPVGEEPPEFYDLRALPEISEDGEEPVAVDAAWLEGPEEPEWTNINHKACCPNLTADFRSISRVC